MGIGASSSAAYTLRKHYTKNILPFECHFDRGGIDPLPIIQQVEAGSKKKTAKAASVPSPGKSRFITHIHSHYTHQITLNRIYLIKPLNAYRLSKI